MSASARLPVVIDTDPGADDAVAILLALGSPELDVRAITTVAGNVGLALTTANALRLLELAGRADIPVHAGCPRPILRRLETAMHVHGDDGLKGAEHLPPPRMAPAAEHAVPALIRLLRAAGPATDAGGGLTLLTLGPLTNVALALVQAPDIVACIRRVIMMGGARRGGNVTPVAEFNVIVDPHAARVVFESGVSIVMIGLDVTHQVLSSPERIARLGAIGTPVARTVAAILAAYDRFDVERYGGVGAPLHDPCVMAYALRPDLFAGRSVHVAIETDSPLTLGQTVADWWGKTGRAANALVLDQVDADGIYALLAERLARLSAADRRDRRRDPC